ncbi:MAG: antibiotic biosynthesis monooxygenase family protein [Paracoccaceae bacterium]
MTAMNVVHMRVKPGKEQDFIKLHKDMSMKEMPGGRSFSLVKTGERSFVVVGEWDSMAAMVAARPMMIQSLDALRPILEDLGGGRGVTEPYSGEVALTLRS